MIDNPWPDCPHWFDDWLVGNVHNWSGSTSTRATRREWFRSMLRKNHARSRVSQIFPPYCIVRLDKASFHVAWVQDNNLMTLFVPRTAGNGGPIKTHENVDPDRLELVECMPGLGCVDMAEILDSLS